MASCDQCGEQKGFLEMSSKSGICKKCFQKREAENAALGPEQVASNKAAIDNVRMTTSIIFSDSKISHEFGIVSSQCVFGQNILKDLGAALTDVVGGRSRISQKALRDSKEVALNEMKEQASALGANAIVAVKMDMMELSGATLGGSNMIMFHVYGTAVKLVSKQPK